MPTNLTTDEMKAKVRSHFEDFVNNRKAEVIRTNMTTDFYDHDGPGEEPTDSSGDEQMMRQMYAAMPDLHLTIEDLIAEGDKVVCKNHWRWTDPSSGKRMGFHGFVLWRFEGDKIAERWATVTKPAEILVGVNTRAGSPVAALTEAYLAAVGRGEGIAAAERYFHSDIVYIVNGPPMPVDRPGLPSLSTELHSALPWLGIYRGLDEVRAFLAHMQANLDVTGFGPREIVADSERAAVFGWFGLRSRPEGLEIRSAFSILVEERDGKIARYQFLENTFEVALAFRSGGAWAVQTDGTTKTVPAER